MKQASITNVAALATYTFIPSYEFVNSDSRYADFIKTCDEWRLKTVRIKLTPTM